MKKFLLMSFVLLSTSGILFAKKTKKAIKPTKEIRQVILVQFKKSVTAKDVTSLEKYAAELKKKSRTLQKLDWGKPMEVKGNESEHYDFCLTFRFKNDTFYEIFQQNPMRMEFMGKLIPMTKDILSYTYHINE